ncbi:MAG: AAA family ATPase [Oligoflexia bacterium]|nr:AAA family ATPase [Oligoflexia bacterium]MBF0364587.1 AAA family ATPase [Oligoflexia bacterium]
MSKTEDWLKSFKRETASIENDWYKNKKAVSISISSGKGGVGKTSLAIKVAIELSKEGYRVLLIDCDFNLSNTLIKLGLPLNNFFYEFIHRGRSFWDALYRNGHFHLLAGCNGHVGLFEQNIHFDQLIIDIINEYESNFDYIILDSPGGISKTTLNLNAYTQKRIVVVTPDKSSITDSYSLIKLLKIRYGIYHNYLVVNRYCNEKQVNKVFKTMDETVENFLGLNLIHLGGIKEFHEKTDCFDTHLLNNSDSSFHQHFLNIVKNLHDNEKLGEHAHSSPLFSDVNSHLLCNL